MFSNIMDWLVIDSRNSSPVDTEEQPLPFCGFRAFRNYRLKMGDRLTACVRAPGHKGKHVYCIKVAAGMDHRSHALHYQEEITRRQLKPIAIAEMRGNVRESSDEVCAAVYQILEYNRERNANGRKT